MVRQCAWCLRLIDITGERISTAPLPKLYEATHGMCGVCGALWMEQALGLQGTRQGNIGDKQPLETKAYSADEPREVSLQALAEMTIRLH